MVLRRMPASGRGVDCFLGGACASGIPYHLLSSARASPGARPVTNFFRGWEDLCRKSRCVQTLRDYVRGGGGAASGGTLGTMGTLGAERREWFRGAVPESFLFFPAQSELDETKLFTEAYGRHAEKGRRTWILKPSDGGKGKDIVIMDSLPGILHFLDDRPRTGRGSVPWVVQKYIEDPLLLPGDRKFDIRCWVLVTRDYRTYLYRDGVLRTTSVPYTGADDLSNQFVHLSNHCIQTSHPDYGKVPEHLRGAHGGGGVCGGGGGG
jgi:tubulin--tyrosine ligase